MDCNSMGLLSVLVKNGLHLGYYSMVVHSTEKDWPEVDVVEVLVAVVEVEVKLEMKVHVDT